VDKQIKKTTTRTFAINEVVLRFTARDLRKSTEKTEKLIQKKNCKLEWVSL